MKQMEYPKCPHLPDEGAPFLKYVRDVLTSLANNSNSCVLTDRAIGIMAAISSHLEKEKGRERIDDTYELMMKRAHFARRRAGLCARAAVREHLEGEVIVQALLACGAKDEEDAAKKLHEACMDWDI